MVEYNAGDYVTYLRNVFSDDPRFIKAADGWGQEEVQHGVALARWAKLADPSFDFEESFRRFKAGFRLQLDVTSSVRGSRTGELIARCMVETGTSSYYSALADSTDEPALKAICRNIANDEFAHYALFHTHMRRYMQNERLGVLRRLKVAFGRIAESEDDELGYAFHAANCGDAPYDRKAAIRAYQRYAFPRYRDEHVRRGVGMVLSAVGLAEDGRLARAMTRLALALLRVKANGMARAAA
jgi:rubrerythrin